MILRDVSSSLRVHRSSAANGVRYPFTTRLQRDWREGEESHTRVTTKRTVHCKQVHDALVVGRKWWCEEKAYPVNHQKRIFDRKEASLTGHGFWNISNTRFTAVFTVNELTIKAEPHLLARVICRSGVFIELLCSISTVQLSFCQVSTSGGLNRGKREWRRQWSALSWDKCCCELAQDEWSCPFMGWCICEEGFWEGEVCVRTALDCQMVETRGRELPRDWINRV